MFRPLAKRIARLFWSDGDLTNFSLALLPIAVLAVIVALAEFIC